MQDPAGFKTGYIAIIGRPNTGKSTILNGLVDSKISIVSRKPQTTRWHIQGIKTTVSHQFIFVDTPGYQREHTQAVNRLMNKEVLDSLSYCDLVLFVAALPRWQNQDDTVLKLLENTDTPVILLLNKVDLVDNKTDLLPVLDTAGRKFVFAEVLPLCARKQKDLLLLEEKLGKYMPDGGPYYDPGLVTNRNERFLASEYLREKIFLQLGDELPYRTAVTIESFASDDKLVTVHATIWVEKETHKSIILGEKGSRIKSIGNAARIDMEEFFGKKVYLQTWVKLKKNWTDDAKALQQLGYNNTG